MTVSSTTSRADYNGNGVTVLFSIPFYFIENGHIVATLTDTGTSPATVTTLVFGTDYTLAGAGNPLGGSATLTVPPTTTQALDLNRVVPATQETHYVENDTFPSSAHEQALDKLTMIDQQILEVFNRALIAPIPETALLPLPSALARAGMILAFDANGQPTVAGPAAATAASVSLALTALTVSLAGANGAGLVGYQASGTGAVIRPVQAKLRDLPVSAEDFGGKGDGAFDNAVAFARAAAAGVSLSLSPGGLYITSQTLGPMAAGTRIYGNGATILARAGALLGELYWPTAADIIVDGLIFDGNRANGGMATDVSYVVYLPVSGAQLLRSEIRGGTRYGIGLGANTPVDGVTIAQTWIHDNGGVTDDTGIGVGIGRIGSVFPTNVKIVDNTIERNHNTISRPNDSSGINGLANGAIITGNFLRDNYNVNGGQLAVGGGNPADDTTIVSNNIIKQTGTFGGDATCGIEINANNAICTGNIVEGASADAIRVEGSSTGIAVANNVLGCAQTAVNLINSGGTGPGKVKINGNVILTAATGISSQTSATGELFAENNYIDPSVTTPIAGASNFTRLLNNTGYAPVQTSGAVAGASPYIWPFVPYDVLYVLSTAGGISSHALDGVGMSVAAGVPILVKAGHTFSTAWATTAPTYSIAPCQ